MVVEQRAPKPIHQCIGKSLFINDTGISETMPIGFRITAGMGNANPDGSHRFLDTSPRGSCNASGGRLPNPSCYAA